MNQKTKIEDIKNILYFIKELVKYKKVPNEVTATENSLFGEKKTAEAIVCRLNKKLIEFAVYFYNYSTWLGKKDLYLEDLYVEPEYRKMSVGKALFNYIITIASKNKYTRLEWKVLDWNKPAIDFYESIGAKAQNEW